MDLGKQAHIDPEPRNRPFQFSLRTLFVVVTIVAVLCSGLLASPPWGRKLTLAFLALTSPVVFIALVIYGRGYLRAFAIGGVIALAPLAVTIASYGLEMFAGMFTGDGMLDALSQDSGSGYWEATVVAAYTGITILFGLLVMSVRWMLQPPEQPHASRSPISPPHVIREPVLETATQEPKDNAA
jgi:hypothetical protein